MQLRIGGRFAHPMNRMGSHLQMDRKKFGFLDVPESGRGLQMRGAAGMPGRRDEDSAKLAVPDWDMDSPGHDLRLLRI